MSTIHAIVFICWIIVHFELSSAQESKTTEEMEFDAIGQYGYKMEEVGGENLIPCQEDDSVLINGICIHCIQPINYEPSYEISGCADFYREKSILFYKGNSTVKYGLITVSQNRNSKDFCPRGFGCLKHSNEGLEVWKISEGAKALTEKKLRVVTIERHPFVKVTERRKYSGVCFEIVKVLKEKYNFSMDVFPPYDGNWGSATVNGTWNGMVGQVIRKEADIGVAGFSVTYDRSRVIDFSSSYYQEETAILIPPPTLGTAKITILIKPFSSIVWGVLFLTLTSVAPALYFLHVVSLKVSTGMKEKKGFIRLTSDILYFLIGSLVQESLASPLNRGTRFLIIIWWFCALTLANVYVAYLIAYLAAPKLSNVVDNLEGLVKQTNIKWTFRINTAHQSLFKSPTSTGVYKAVGDGVSIDQLANSDAEGVQQVLTGKYAFIKEKSFLDVALGHDFLNSNGECRMTLAKERFFKVETAFILPKGSTLLHLVNQGINRAVTTGLMEKWKAIHWERSLWCEDAVSYIPTTIPSVRKLEVEDLGGAWFLLGVGALVSSLGFLLEHFLYSRSIRVLLLQQRL